MAVKTSPPGWGPAPSPARAVTTTTRPATSINVLIRRMLELPEADGPRDRLEVVLGVAEVERCGLDPLVDQVQRRSEERRVGKEWRSRGSAHRGTRDSDEGRERVTAR